MQYIGENNLDQMIATKGASATATAPGTSQKDAASTADYEAILSAIIHDMRSPLGVLAAIRELLSDSAPPDSEQAGYLNYLDNAVGHTQRIIEDATQIRNLLTGAYFVQNSLLNINDLVNSIVSRREDISYLRETRILEDIAPGVDIRADKKLFEQVFLRILEETANYTSVGGIIRITASVQNEQLKLSLEPAPKDFAQRFNPRPPQMELHGRMGYSGFGRSLYTLSLCHSVINNMGGNLHIENSPEGFSAIIYYPLAEAV